MEPLIKALNKKQNISIRDLRKLLISQITADELAGMKNNSEEYIISEYNRQTICRMMCHDCSSGELIECSRIVSLEKRLQDYLDQYMSSQPSGHKWIILSCLFLTFVLKEPMHPREIVHWEKDENCGEYYCPAYSSEEGSTCCYCVCDDLAENR